MTISLVSISYRVAGPGDASPGSISHAELQFSGPQVVCLKINSYFIFLTYVICLVYFPIA